MFFARGVGYFPFEIFQQRTIALPRYNKYMRAPKYQLRLDQDAQALRLGKRASVA